MNKSTEISLINGSFEPQDAKEVLLTILNNKIAFHEKKVLASREHTGIDSIASLKRIKELRHAAEQIRNIVTEANDNKLKLKIDANLVIELEETMFA